MVARGQSRQRKEDSRGIERFKGLDSLGVKVQGDDDGRSECHDVESVGCGLGLG